MKSILKYGILSCVLCMMFSCVDEVEFSQNQPYIPSGTFEDGIEITLAFPDMSTVTSRAIDDGFDPKLEELDIFLFVFDGNSLKQTIHIPAADTELADGADGDTHLGLTNHIKFTAYLPQTDNNAIVHIVALKDTYGDFADEIDAVGYGLEDIVMPKLAVSGKQDAYWQRIDLGCPIICSVDNSDDSGLEDVVGTEGRVRPQFELVKLVRNFAKVTMRLSDELQQKGTFSIVGWTLVNDLDGGSVTPWFSPIGRNDIVYPTYVKPGGTISSYEDLVAQGYPGVSYSGAQLQNTLDEVSSKGSSPSESGNEWGAGDKYLYDRKVSSINPLYILIYGDYRGVRGYYKVSLAYRNTTTGLVSEYNVMRNIEYNIVITDVTAAGYPTPSDAASGPAFNNVSGDVTTRSMLQISDGVDMLYVNFVTYVVTQKDQEVVLMFRYLEDIVNNKANQVRNDKVIWNALTDPNNAGVGITTTKTNSSAVITSLIFKDGDEYVITDDITDSGIVNSLDTIDQRTGLAWKRLRLKFIDPTDEIKEQKVILYTPPQEYENADGTKTKSVGLSRTINFVVRNPWDYERVRIYPGEWANDNVFPDWNPAPGTTPDDEGEIYIGGAKGDALTLFFELPAGLPESMFPLEFIIESDRQNIENAGAGNASVQNGESLFKNDQGVNDLRIQYKKTVLWSEYAPNGTSTPSSRIIRARFLTTTSMEDYPDNVKSIVTTVRLHNPAFNDADYKFTRVKGKIVDRTERYHIEIVNTWDFNDSSWDYAAENCDKSRNFSTSVVGKIDVIATKTVTKDGVTTVENIDPGQITGYSMTMSGSNNAAWSTRCFISDRDSDGDRYFLSRYDQGDDKFTFTINTKKPASIEGTLTSKEIRITVSDNENGTTNNRELYVSGNTGWMATTKRDYVLNPTGIGNTTYNVGARRTDERSQIRFYGIKVTEKYDSEEKIIYKDIDTNPPTN
ncbi:MAG: hypothetical protein J1F20_08680 [Muribaculaceae bacterium]|nr:hypothetical protein [Muribaculaceae bacterium]